MYIALKYGDGTETVYVNPDCQCKNFVDYIRAKIPLILAYEQQNEEDGPWLFDLCDELGFLKYLPEKQQTENLAVHFDNRMVYIPILATKTTDGMFKNLVPLIEDVGPEMDKRLKKYLRARGKKDIERSTSPSAKTPKTKQDKVADSANKKDRESPTSGELKKSQRKHLSKSRTGTS